MPGMNMLSSFAGIIRDMFYIVSFLHIFFFFFFFEDLFSVLADMIQKKNTKRN